MTRRLSVIILALLLDAFLGDPPNRWHPVAWMGSAIAFAREHAPDADAPPARQMLHGAIIVTVGSGAAALAGSIIARIANRLPSPLAWMLEAIALNTTLSLRGLTRAAGQVEDALGQGDLPAARHWLGWHLVSRATEDLDASQVAAATIESVAENASDGVIAPLFFYALGGLPAALAYRFINTADAMLGYRDPAREWLGKIPARLDDAVNWIPARLTALLIIFGAPLAAADSRRAWRVWRRDARATASPNAGHPMSAMAGALGVRLEKSGHYVLGDELPSPRAFDIARSVRVARWAVALGVLGCLLAGLAATRRPCAPSKASRTPSPMA